MRRAVLPVLLALDLALLAMLALMWFTPRGQLIDIGWKAPAPLRPDLGASAAMPETGVDLSRYVATLERPLFVASRRPPPPPQLASAPPAPVYNALPDIRLMAVYGNKDAGGAVARVDGRVRRLKVGDSLGGWTVKDLRTGSIDIALADDVRTIELKRSIGNEPNPAPGAAPERGPATSGSAGVDAIRQREAEAARAQTRRMNVLRAKLGMAPLPEP